MSLSALPSAAESASRPSSRGGILTPSNEVALNRQNGLPSSEGRGGKRASSVAMEHLLKPAIAIKPHPPNLHVPPRLLHPLMLLPRENLPLACIDCAGSGGDLGQSRFFEAHIRILDLESRMGSVPVILVARYEPRGTVYALERQRNGLYVACKLGDWVDLDDLAEHATAVAQRRMHPVKVERRDDGGIDALTTPQLHHEHKKKRAAIEAIQSLVKKRTRSGSISLDDLAKREHALDPDVSIARIQSPEARPEEQSLSQQPRSQQQQQHLLLEPPAGAAPPSSPPLPRPPAERTQELIQSLHHTADDIFDNIRTHYFDALYRSMGSLAYFAKGPLSRARSAFHLDLEANLDMDDLVEFLRGLILTTIQIDKKYRETIPELLARMKAHMESSDEGRRKKRRSKKMKIGKDGLYPLEDESIQKWWTANKAELSEHEAGISTSQAKSHISILRTRETQLQMIIIMEILALESLKASVDPGESILPGLPGMGDSQDQSASCQPKKRNKHNLPVLLDVHADRLTIWQSTATDEQLLLEDSQSARSSLEGTREKKASSEPLKDFCVDVIVPFFSARLPDLCDSINRKLGGPTIMTPAKSKSSKFASSRDQKPGSVAKRPTPQSARRTLQRALSTDQQNRRSVSRGPSNAIALLRSATSTTIPSVKRENGDAPLLMTRPSHESLKRSSSMSNLRDVKASSSSSSSTRKAEVDAELKEAISALRRPNRAVVGKAMAEADERRSSSLSIKKSRRPAAVSRASNVQVKATPAKNRFRDMMARPCPSDATQSSVFVDSGVDMIPPSSVGPVARSTGQVYGDSFRRSPSPDGIVGDTPIRQPSFMRRPADAQSPLELDLVGSEARTSVQPRGHGGTDNTVGATPLKKPTRRLIFGDQPEAKPVAQEKAASIYEKLGWDDDFDDLA